MRPERRPRCFHAVSPDGSAHQWKHPRQLRRFSQTRFGISQNRFPALCQSRTRSEPSSSPRGAVSMMTLHTASWSWAASTTLFIIIPAAQSSPDFSATDVDDHYQLRAPRCHRAAFYLHVSRVAQRKLSQPNAQTTTAHRRTCEPTSGLTHTLAKP